MTKKRFTILPFWIQNGFMKIVQPLISIMHKLKIHPNTLTFLGFFITSYSFYFYYNHNIKWAGFWVLIGGIFDAIDGSVARRSGLSSKFGALLDSTLDRYSEIVMFLGITAHYVLIDDFLTAIIAIIALGGSMMVSYVRARAEALGFDCKVGLMQRPERVVYIGGISMLAPQFLSYTIYIIAVLVNITVIHRVLYVYRAHKNAD